MTPLGLLVRFLLFLIVARLVLRFVAGVVRGLQAPPARRPAPGPAPELVRDPVCNTFVTRERAVAGTFEGHDALFCSAACRDKAAGLLS